MEIIITTPKIGEEDQIIIKCRNIDDELMKMITKLKMRQEMLVGYENDIMHRIHSSRVYYFESVDKKTYMYTEDKVLEIKQKLYQLEEMYRGSDFIRISKSVILNVSKVISIYPTFSGRFEAILENMEKTEISRKYVPDLKKKISEWED